jgi:predicted Zn-dependent peptidase
MIDFEVLDGPGGIPIYFQSLPVKTVSVYWLVFTGSADDDDIGAHGIYHWFEHLPSRGTERYPGGYQDTEARLVRYGGDASAETGYNYTGYSAYVPKRVWIDAFDILTDMIAAPLLREEDILGEREVIRQEIDEWYSSPYGQSLCELPGLLWPGHPLGHDQLGSHESLDSISPQLLRKAHEKGYSRSRCVLMVAGNLTKEEVLNEVAERVDRLPDLPLETRRAPIHYGPLPAWRPGETNIIETTHDDSIVYLMFPMPAIEESGDDFLRITLLDDLITAGNLGSPLNRIVRERSQLAYAPGLTSSLSPDGGYWGLVAQTNSDRHQAVVDTFWEVLDGDEIRSPEWFDYVRDTVRGEIEMHDPCPDDYTEAASARLTFHGKVWSDDEYLERLMSISRDELISYLESFSRDISRTIVFAGES